MQDAAQAQQGGMVALVGADEAQATQVCDQARASDVLVCASFNALGQIVLSGHKTACERAANVAADLGLRAPSSPSPAPSIRRSCSPPPSRLRAALDKTSIREPRCPVVANVTAAPHAPAGGSDWAAPVRKLLFDQLTSPVRWAESCRWMAANVKGEYHEPAPGKTLAGLMRRIDKALKVTTHEEPGT